MVVVKGAEQGQADGETGKSAGDVTPSAPCVRYVDCVRQVHPLCKTGDGDGRAPGRVGQKQHYRPLTYLSANTLLICAVSDH